MPNDLQTLSPSRHTLCGPWAHQLLSSGPEERAPNAISSTWCVMIITNCRRATMMPAIRQDCSYFWVAKNPQWALDIWMLVRFDFQTSIYHRRRQCEHSQMPLSYIKESKCRLLIWLRRPSIVGYYYHLLHNRKLAQNHAEHFGQVSHGEKNMRWLMVWMVLMFGGFVESENIYEAKGILAVSSRSGKCAVNFSMRNNIISLLNKEWKVKKKYSAYNTQQNITSV